MSLVKIAIHSPTGKYLHINEASNGLSCECTCPKCDDQLEAIQGKVRDQHFRHSNHENCEGAQETALHKLAKQILAESSVVSIPKIGEISYSESVVEHPIGDFVADVGAKHNGDMIFFEVVVTNPMKINKKQFYTDNNYKCLEINLQGLNLNSYEEIKKTVLEDLGNKKVIFWEKKSNPFNPWPYILGIGALITFLYLFFSGKSSKQKVRSRQI